MMIFAPTDERTDPREIPAPSEAEMEAMAKADARAIESIKELERQAAETF